MLLPVSKPDAAKLFGFINMLYERCSFIITTNKSPQEWVEMLDDEVLATALLDRLLFKCKVIVLDRDSWRLYKKLEEHSNNECPTKQADFCRLKKQI